MASSLFELGAGEEYRGERSAARSWIRARPRCQEPRLRRLVDALLAGLPGPAWSVRYDGGPPPRGPEEEEEPRSAGSERRWRLRRPWLSVAAGGVKATLIDRRDRRVRRRFRDGAVEREESVEAGIELLVDDGRRRALVLGLDAEESAAAVARVLRGEAGEAAEPLAEPRPRRAWRPLRGLALRALALAALLVLAVVALGPRLLEARLRRGLYGAPRLAAIQGLARAGGGPVALAELRSDDPWARRNALGVLLTLDHPEAADRCAAALDDPAAAVRALAVAGLRRLGAGADLERFAREPDAPTNTRRLAWRALAAVRGAQARAAALSFLAEHGEPGTLKLEVLRLFPRLFAPGSPPALERLRRALAEAEDPAAARALLAAYRELGGSALPILGLLRARLEGWRSRRRLSGEEALLLRAALAALKAAGLIWRIEAELEAAGRRPWVGPEERATLDRFLGR